MPSRFVSIIYRTPSRPSWIREVLEAADDDALAGKARKRVRELREREGATEVKLSRDLNLEEP